MLNSSLSECVDLEMTMSAFRAAFFVDFGAVNRLWTLYAQQKLRREEHNVVRLSLFCQPPRAISQGTVPLRNLLCHLCCTYGSSSVYCRLVMTILISLLLQQQRRISNSWAINLHQVLLSTSLCR